MSPGPSASPWRAAAAQVVVDDLADPTLSAEDLHHLSRVLRVRSGASICATDGRGGWRMTAFVGHEQLDATGELESQAGPAYPIGVAFALVKGQRPELVVQKLTEIGVDRIVLFGARRSVVRWEADRRDKNLLRLRRVAREACGQCRRLWLPVVEVADLSELVVDGTAGAGTVAADAGGRRIGPEDRTILIGPEGGWEPGEIDTLPRVSLGEHILRAETAAMTAGAILSAIRSGLVDPAA